MAVLQGPGAGRVRIVISPSTVVGRAADGGVTGIPFATLASYLSASLSFVPTSAVGAAGGVAGLDGGGKVPTSQLPAAIVGSVKYKGTWNANTNSPTLPGSPTAGDYYVVSVPGATNLSGITDWKAGDWAICDGTNWGKVDNTDNVTSVAGKTGVVTLSTADVSGAQDVSQKDANNGYAGLDPGGAVLKPVQEVKVWNPPTTAGKMGLNGGTICFGDGAAVRKLLHDGNIGTANGVAGLDPNSAVSSPVQSVRAWNPPNNAGGIGYDAALLKYGDGAQVRVLLHDGMKGSNNGVCDLDNGGKVPANRLSGSLLPASASRRWNGTTAITAGQTVDLTVVTRNANEMFQFWAFVQEATAGANWPGPGAGGADKVAIWLERTANDGEFKLRANNGAGVTRTLEWFLSGVVP